MNQWVELAKTFFLSLIGVSKAVEVRTKPEEIQISEFELEKPRIETKELLRLADMVFKEVKNNMTANIESEVRFLTKLNEEDTLLLIENVSNRVKEYRREHPIISGWRRFNKRGK